MEAFLNILLLGTMVAGVAGLVKPSLLRMPSRKFAGAVLAFGLVPTAALDEFYAPRSADAKHGMAITMLALWAVGVFVIPQIIRYNRRLRADWQKQWVQVSAPQRPQNFADVEERRQRGEDYLTKLRDRRANDPVRSSPVDLAKLDVAIRDVRVTPPTPTKRKGRVEQTALEPVDASIRDHSSGWAGHISYVDAKGESSERLIVVKRIEGYGRAETVFAYCCERKASRRFLVKGIKELYCAETGEVLDPKKHFDMLASKGAIDTTDKSLADLITILVFLARCDGEFHPLEMESINGAIEEHMMYFGGDRKSSRKAAISARQLAPDNVDFMNAINRLGMHPRSALLAGIILDYAEDVIEADGNVTADEDKWQYMVFDALEDMALAKAA